MAEIAGGESEFAELHADVGILLVRELEQVVEDAELVHDLERGGVDRVAAEIAEEVAVLFQDDDVDAGSGEQITEHDAGRPAAGDTTGGADGLRVAHEFLL